MTSSTTGHLFGPKATKADITDQAARAIITAEAARRDAKTERLRQARLKREAAMASSGA